MANKSTVEFRRKTPKGKGVELLAKRTKPAGIVVGILKGTGAHPKATKGQTFAEIAFWNEFGTRTRSGRVKVPARSFLRSTLFEKKRDYKKATEKLLSLMLKGKINDKKAEGVLGFQVQKDIQQKILTLSSPPNAEATEDLKKSSNPLIDTGALRQHIHWASVRGFK